VESLSGDGNLFAGFEEVVPWPSVSPEPADYPSFPGRLNSGDWIYGTGVGYGTQPITDALKVLSDTQRIIMLPIYSERIGQDNTTKLFIVQLRDFVVIDYGYLPGRGNYLTLIALGEALASPICGLSPDTIAERNHAELISNKGIQTASP
jgi:hypothetical protein